MAHELRWIAPTPPDPEIEILEVHQVAFEFHAEVRHREAFERYCQWYAQVSQQHQQEHLKLQRDWNLMGWFTPRHSA